MTSTARTQRLVLTGAGLAAASVLAAGCGPTSTNTSAGSPATTTTTSTAPASPPATSPASSAPSTSSPATSSPASSSPSASPTRAPGSGGTGSGGTKTGGTSAAACTTSHLKGSVGSGQGAAGSVYLAINFTNTGGAPCTLYGYPGVSLDNNGGVIGAAATRDSSHGGPKQITLAPGGKANAILRVAHAQNYPSSTCKPDSAWFLKVYPPNQTEAIDIQYKSTGCQNASVKLLTITVVASGAG